MEALYIYKFCIDQQRQLDVFDVDDDVQCWDGVGVSKEEADQFGRVRSSLHHAPPAHPLPKLRKTGKPLKSEDPQTKFNWIKMERRRFGFSISRARLLTKEKAIKRFTLKLFNFGFDLLTRWGGQVDILPTLQLLHVPHPPYLLYKNFTKNSFISTNFAFVTL